MFLEESNWLVSRIIEENRNHRKVVKPQGRHGQVSSPPPSQKEEIAVMPHLSFIGAPLFYSNNQSYLWDYHANQTMKVGTKDMFVPLNLNLKKKSSVLKFIFKIAETTLQILALLR